MTESAGIFIEKLTTKIKLNSISVSEKISNQVIKIAIPQAGDSKKNANAPLTKYKDIKRFKHTFTLTGLLSFQTATIKGTSQLVTATQAKNVLINYILYGADKIYFYWTGLSKQDSTFNDALSAIMDATDSSRKHEVVVELVEFKDSGRKRYYKEYAVSDGFDFDESSPRVYEVSIKFVRATVL